MLHGKKVSLVKVGWEKGDLSITICKIYTICHTVFKDVTFKKNM